MRPTILLLIVLAAATAVACSSRCQSGRRRERHRRRHRPPRGWAPRPPPPDRHTRAEHRRALLARGEEGAAAARPGVERCRAGDRPGPRPGRPLRAPTAVPPARRRERKPRLVRQGAAAPYFYGGDLGRYAHQLLSAAKAAKAARRGLWGACPGTVLHPYRAIETHAKDATPRSLVPRSGCDPSYPTVCIPPYPPDLDCDDVPTKGFQGRRHRSARFRRGSRRRRLRDLRRGSGTLT